jgi:hypothetical protein
LRINIMGASSSSVAVQPRRQKQAVVDAGARDRVAGANGGI